MSDLLTNWGNHPRVSATLLGYESDEQARDLVSRRAPLIPRGLGRCYGDSSLAPTVLSTLGRARIIEVDADLGSCTCDAGLSLGRLLGEIIPLGWFLPVVPGTREVTIGGAIASDIHGKNHHAAGAFSRYVDWMDLLLPDGGIRRITPESDTDLFHATAGGMGLTGIILRARVRLVPVSTAFIRKETVVAPDLDAAMALLKESESWTYSVAWIDCQARGRRMGRSLIFRGEHADPGDLPGDTPEPLALPRGRALTIPFNLPSLTLNPLSVRAFNEVYFRRNAASAGGSIEGLSRFFFPLDAVDNWNRIYGRRGFYQYQAVLPMGESEKGVAEMLKRISASGLGSFLGVIKRMGHGGGMLSFPLRGFTLALDFPAGRRTLALFDELDALVLRHGGRLYLTKDARMSRTMLDEGYPEADRFRELRRQLNADGVFASLQSRRLGL